jgi:hypothetical protein
MISSLEVEDEAAYACSYTGLGCLQGPMERLHLIRACQDDGVVDDGIDPLLDGLGDVCESEGRLIVLGCCKFQDTAYELDGQRREWLGIDICAVIASGSNLKVTFCFPRVFDIALTRMSVLLSAHLLRFLYPSLQKLK